ncbi:transporter permease [Alkaliphilus peptidifermentans]|uniref:Mg2+/citrate symporter n=1 Tax=Alkaliphilus peptidifermentans DSM 18978 TaxID=1120976 RepID=A0A1G5AAK3_9FIRM|nr:citrate transporter [Alkaliphilus peptidifermentans]SCX74910.1 Mg2+/citrate symporter [Alkaliphilus peptidifermentans DSM 18978]
MVTWFIVIIFLVMCALMYTKKLSAMFALPLMAFLIALVSGIPFNDVPIGETIQPGIMKLMFIEGPVRLASPIMMLIFGAILAQFVKNSGIAETVIRKVSEFAGDRPTVLGIVFMLVLSVLFTSLGGLGSVIMIGSIVLPIMTSVGISSLTAGCILLFALSTGGIFNLANWGLYIEVMGLSVEQIKFYAYFLGVIFILAGILFVIFETKSNSKFFFGKKGKVLWAMPSAELQDQGSFKKVNVLAMLTPIVPLILVLGLGWDIIAGFVAAIMYGLITTINKDSIKILTKCVTQGISDSAGAIFLMIGIGMLLKVVMDSRVTQHIGPYLANILPTTGITFIIFFSLLAPLALYRGPLNVWGLGLGIGAMMMTTGRMPGLAIMAALMSTGQIQGICDPTNTHNVWTAASVGKDVNDILRKTLPYVWIAAIVGLVVAGVLYF